MLYCHNFFWNVLQVWMTGKDVYLQMTWSWQDKTWNILCSYCLQWNTSQSKFRNHYFLFLFAFSILSQLFLIWGCTLKYAFRVGMSVVFGLCDSAHCKFTQWYFNIQGFHLMENTTYHSHGSQHTSQRSQILPELKSLGIHLKSSD